MGVILGNGLAVRVDVFAVCFIRGKENGRDTEWRKSRRRRGIIL